MLQLVDQGEERHRVVVVATARRGDPDPSGRQRPLLEGDQLGYQGRMGIYELLLLNEAVRPLVLNRSPASTIAQRAIEQGMRTLRADGWNKVRDGVTTIEEVLRVTQTEEHLNALLGDSKVE